MKIQREKRVDRHDLYCQVCDAEIENEGNYFLIEDRDGDVLTCCPECAAVYLAETLDAVSGEYEWEDNVMGWDKR